jgi:hypothetical protein
MNKPTIWQVASTVEVVGRCCFVLKVSTELYATHCSSDIKIHFVTCSIL